MMQCELLPPSILRSCTMQRKLPSWIAFWLVFSSVVCVIDALFVLLRPHTLPGGKWNYIFKPYNIYIQVDQRYKDLKDGFVIGQSWMNLVEVGLNMITLIQHGKSSITSLISGLVVCTMTCAKTILFTLMATELCGAGDVFKDVDWSSLVGLFIIPNSIWIAVPLICIIKFSSVIIDNIEDHPKKD